VRRIDSEGFDRGEGSRPARDAGESDGRVTL